MLTNLVPERTPGAAQEPFKIPAPHTPFGAADGTSDRAPPRGMPHAASLAWQLGELQRRSRDVLGHSLIRHPAGAALRQLGQQLLANVRLIQILQRQVPATSDESSGSLPLVTELLASSHQLLDCIVAQVSLCRATERETRVLADTASRLFAQQPFKFHKLLTLYDRVCDEVRRAPRLSLLIPVAGLPLAALVETLSPTGGTPVFVGGITTARILVWALGNLAQYSDRLPRLVLAALLQDVGRLSDRYRGRPGQIRDVQHTHWIDRQHPTIGAALFGAVRGAPIELAMLVSQHHEQLDGAGFPRNLPASEILPDAAILAATVRFTELCLVCDPEATCATVLPSRPTRAIQVLLSEAEWGKWPLPFCRQLAERIAVEEGGSFGPVIKSDSLAQFSSETDAAETDAAASPEAIPPDVDRSLQLHDEEVGLQGTHSDSSQRPAAALAGDAWLRRRA